MPRAPENSIEVQPLYNLLCVGLIDLFTPELCAKLQCFEITVLASPPHHPASVSTATAARAGKPLFVYSDIAGSLWANRFDLHRTAGELRSAVSTECLQGLLPSGISSAQLNIYYVRDGMAYEPEDTFRLRLRDRIDICHPRRIGTTTELSEVVGEMHRGHIYLIIGLPDRPLVTVPTEKVVKNVATTTDPVDRLTNGEQTKSVDLATGFQNADACSRDRSFGLSSAMQPSEVSPASGSSHCRTDHLELLSPSFAYFLSLSYGASHHEDEAFIARASRFVGDRLINVSTDLRDVKAFGLAFTELLQPAREDVYRVDHNGVISMYYRIEDEDIKVSAPFLVFQPDLESSPTGGDNAVESAIRACDETWDKQHRKWVYSANCCPIFVVMFSSSSLSVYGSAFTHKWVFQGLTQACITFTNIIDPSAFGTLARLLWALRQSVSHLQEWYRKTVLASVFPQFYDRLHPATTSVQDQTGAIVGFCYFRRIEPHDKVFLAFAAKRDHAFAVKFTPRYCAEAHRFLAEANCAPDLVYCGSPYTEFPGYTRMQMVVTEFCPEGLILWEIARKPLRDKLRDAIALLHSQGMVHGDLRWQNILVDRDGHIRLIDFDWAGIEGVARCPDDLAEDVPWPAEPGALITKEHDRYMLERVFKPEAALR